MMMHLLFSSFHRLKFCSYQHVCRPTLWSQPVPRLGQVSQFQNHKINQRWNSWTAFYSRGFLRLLRLEFLSGFLTTFFLSTKCYSCIDSSFLYSWIFFVLLKARDRVWFSLISASWGYCDGAKDWSIFSNWCQRILSQHFLRSFVFVALYKKILKN